MARILIVDDSSVVRQRIRAMLTELKHTVVAEASNGAQAFSEYVQHKPDVVTMDLTMQGMTGATATAKIVATYPDAKIIVISAFEERQIIYDALERGARHFIIKPILPERLAAVLDNVLNQKFDRQKHLELIRKLKEADVGAPPSTTDDAYVPPFQIICQNNNMVIVTINPTFSEKSSQALSIEIEEFIGENAHVLIDFGTVSTLPPEALKKIDQLIAGIEEQSGKVKAISRNQAFNELLAGMQELPNLSYVLRYLPAL